METQRVFRSFDLGKEPGVALYLLGEVAVLSDCIYNDGVLLTLLLEEVAGCDFWQAKYISEISVLVASEFGDMALRDLLEG